MYESYAPIAPNPDGSPDLMDKMGVLLSENYDWAEGVAALEIPTLLMFGDTDSIPVSHATEFFGLLGGGQHDPGWDGSGMSSARLAILPGTTHYNCFSSPLLPQFAGPFLDAE